MNKDKRAVISAANLFHFKVVWPCVNPNTIK